jgi:AcrR family transcriptional regulator
MSPRTPKQFENIREEKKSLIMDVALEHFAREGYHSATITHLAKHAGISKGLMYNYFDSKEALLEAILLRSLKEIYAFFDIEKGDNLSEKDFEIFILKVCQVILEKKSFWRLFFHILMENEVREHFLKSYLGAGPVILSPEEEQQKLFISDIIKVITGYFIRKKDKKEADYDPMMDLNMFVFSMYGYALSNIYTEEYDDIQNSKLINRIIELYK